MKTDSMKNFSKQLIFMFMLMLCGTVTTFGQSIIRNSEN